jgi:hypothetical protein
MYPKYSCIIYNNRHVSMYPRVTFQAILYLDTLSSNSIF